MTPVPPQSLTAPSDQVPRALITSPFLSTTESTHIEPPDAAALPLAGANPPGTKRVATLSSTPMGWCLPSQRKVVGGAPVFHACAHWATVGGVPGVNSRAAGADSPGTTRGRISTPPPPPPHSPSPEVIGRI